MDMVSSFNFCRLSLLKTPVELILTGIATEVRHRLVIVALRITLVRERHLISFVGCVSRRLSSTWLRCKQLRDLVEEVVRGTRAQPKTPAEHTCAEY